MNAQEITNSGALGLSRMLIAQNHRSNAFFSNYEVWTYSWNYRNEKTDFSEKNSSGTVIASGTYTYDSLDRRIGVDETSGGTTTKTWIVYNGNSNTPYAEFNGSGTLLERYLAGPSYVPGVTGMVARTNASGVTDWYLTGKLGSVRDIVNTSGMVIDHISYGAFGSIRAETNPSSGSRFKFDGMQYDSITGLYNDWHRGYSSSTGRFVSQDPLSFSAADSNLYCFTFNSSVNSIDINGFEPSKARRIIEHQVFTLVGPHGAKVFHEYWNYVAGWINKFIQLNTNKQNLNPAQPGKNDPKRRRGHKGRGHGNGAVGLDPTPIIIAIGELGQSQGQAEQNALLQEARADARIVSDFGKAVCSTAKSMITKMISNDLRKYRGYFHGGYHGTLPLQNTITIHISQGGFSGSIYGSGNPGSQWGQGWVGGPDTQTTPPQIDGAGWGGFVGTTGNTLIPTGPILFPGS